MWQNSKNQIGTKLKSDKTQKLKLWKTQNLKLWQKQLIRKFKKSNCKKKVTIFYHIFSFYNFFFYILGQKVRHINNQGMCSGQLFAILAMFTVIERLNMQMSKYD